MNSDEEVDSFEDESSFSFNFGLFDGEADEEEQKSVEDNRLILTTIRSLLICRSAFGVKLKLTTSLLDGLFAVTFFLLIAVDRLGLEFSSFSSGRYFLGPIELRFDLLLGSESDISNSQWTLPMRKINSLINGNPE